MEQGRSCVTESFFDGEVFAFIGWSLLASLLTIITLGIGFPWAVCMMLRWNTNHSIINGYRLHFTGTGLQLLGVWLLVEVLAVFAVIASIMFAAFGAAVFVLALLALVFLFGWFAVYIQGWVVKHTEFTSGGAEYVESQESRHAASENVSARNFAVLLIMGIVISSVGVLFIWLSTPIWMGFTIVGIGCIVLEVAGNQ